MHKRAGFSPDRLTSLLDELVGVLTRRCGAGCPCTPLVKGWHGGSTPPQGTEFKETPHYKGIHLKLCVSNARAQARGLLGAGFATPAATQSLQFMP